MIVYRRKNVWIILTLLMQTRNQLLNELVKERLTQQEEPVKEEELRAKSRQFYIENHKKKEDDNAGWDFTIDEKVSSKSSKATSISSTSVGDTTSASSKHSSKPKPKRERDT